ncbi:crustacyanin-C1 subunit-like [Macrobrachium rosenbergii]|uniref:crustacyanin-C1 subunit-like n=1 Tax=Macrobrachium rosenbergii TaxID=79674 RepID=UPI0034D40E5E
MKTPVRVLVAVLAVVDAVAAATEDFVVPGSCPLVDEASLWARHRPNLWQMDGFWYHHSHTPTPYNPIVNCTQMRLEYIGGSFRTEATGIDEDNAFMKTTGMIYEAAGGKPHLTIAHEKSRPAPLVILDSDYENFACLYSCQDFGGKYYGDFGFLYSRTPKMDPTYVKICQDTFKKIGIDINTFKKTYQGDDCPHTSKKKLQ